MIVITQVLISVSINDAAIMFNPIYIGKVCGWSCPSVSGFLSKLCHRLPSCQDFPGVKHEIKMKNSVFDLQNEISFFWKNSWWPELVQRV